MNYNELKTKASELGMKNVVGAKKEELLAFIEKHSQETSEESQSSVKQTKKNESDFNLANVYDGAHVFRSYDLETHGENFEKLAREFASTRGFRVEMGYLKGKTECPNCGHSWN